MDRRAQPALSMVTQNEGDTMKHYGLIGCVLLVSCLRPSEDNVRLDEVVGQASTDSLTIDTKGQAAVSVLGNSAILWAAAPSLSITIETNESVSLTINNVLKDAELRAGTETIMRLSAERDTQARFNIPARLSGRELMLMTPDALTSDAFKVVVLSDIQEAIDEFGDIVTRINEEEDIDFVVSTGDLTRRGGIDELIRFQEELRSLDVPFFSTVGNHEVPGSQEWHEMFGPFSVFFEYKGVAFTLLDSSTATIDPEAKIRFEEFASLHLERPHLFLTHVPLLDPSGIRSGAFRNRHEGIALASDLRDANVDALFFGHVHSFYTFSLASVPSFISGGGGAIQERLDGIERHYLKVSLDPDSPSPLRDVTVVRVD